MKVRITDLISFYEYRINMNIKLKEKSLIEYSDQKVKYELKFLPKLFGWKFEDSVMGSKSAFGAGNWDMCWCDDRIKSCEVELRKLVYHKKLGDSVCELDRLFEDRFYEFAKDNNLPL